MKSNDKMVQTAFKRQRKRDLELIRLNRNERKMSKMHCAGLGVLCTQGFHPELRRLSWPW